MLKSIPYRAAKWQNDGAIRDLFDKISDVASAASFGRRSTMDALCSIENDWKEIERLMLTDKEV